MFYYFLKYFFGNIIKLIWIGSVCGKENIPKKKPYILAANHESYFDFICLATVFPKRIYFLAGEVFFKRWWWRPFVEMTGQIMVDRNSKDKSDSVKQVLEYLKKNRIVAIFPEGTRSADEKLKKAYTGTVKISLKANVPIVPVGIIGTYEIMSRHDKYPKFKKCKIIFGKPIFLNDLKNGESEEDINFLTHKVLMKQIAQLVDKNYDY